MKTASAKNYSQPIPLKKGDTVALSGDSAEFGLDNYNVRVSSTALVLETPAPGSKQVLVNIDNIDGDGNVNAYVNIEKLRLIQRGTPTVDELLAEAKAKAEPAQMYEYELPVTWEVCGFVKVPAHSLQDAIDVFNKNIDHIPLPSESEYVDGSFALSSDDFEYIEAMSSCKPINIADDQQRANRQTPGAVKDQRER